MIRSALLITAIAAMTLTGQEVSKVTAPQRESNNERSMTENELLKLQLTIAQIQLLQKEYKIEEYNGKISPITAEQQTTITAMCKSVGVPADKVQSECGIYTGVGPDGQPIKGPDGKPTQARVWWQRPQVAEKK